MQRQLAEEKPVEVVFTGEVQQIFNSVQVAPVWLIVDVYAVAGAGFSIESSAKS